MKAILTLVDRDGNKPIRMVMDRDDWSELRFPKATENCSELSKCEVEFENGLKSTVEFPAVSPRVGDVVYLNVYGVKTEQDFREQAMRVTGWKPKETDEEMIREWIRFWKQVWAIDKAVKQYESTGKVLETSLDRFRWGMELPVSDRIGIMKRLAEENRVPEMGMGVFPVGDLAERVGDLTAQKCLVP